MENETEKKGLFSQFPKIFWVVNGLELFERGAYYGTTSVLSVHVYKTLFPDLANIGAVYGALYGMLIFLLYFTPLISAALAEKFGYKRVLIGAFLILVVGYLLLNRVQPGQLGFLALAFIVMGIGAGAFKPIISASIAHVTKDEQRNVAYAIYYWMINLGATLVPLSIGLYFTSISMYTWVFILSSVLISVNLAITFIFYFDPVQPKKDLSVAKAVMKIGPALKDKEFVILLAIYAGFWFMFALNHTFLPWYMLDFQRMPVWFTVPLLATLNPGTIIILGPFLAKFVEKRKSLNVVMLGIIIYIIGLTVLGFSNSPVLFISGIVIFSIGEFVTHPGFIAHVSKIAPKDKVAIYMACIFLATGSGNIVGGIVQGYWYDYFVIELSLPKVFFAAIMCVGLITLCAFILYNRWLISKEIHRDPYARVDTGIWTRHTTIIVAVIFIPILLATAYAGGPNIYYGTTGGGEFTWDIYEDDTFELSQDDYVQEGGSREFTFDVDRPNLLYVNITLIWTDEATDNRHINEPDSFSMTIETPSGAEIDAGSSTGGDMSESIRLDPDEDPDRNGTGEYVITVTCVNAGEQEPLVPDPLGIRTIQDDGNMVYVTVEYTYYVSQV